MKGGVRFVENIGDALYFIGIRGEHDVDWIGEVLVDQAFHLGFNRGRKQECLTGFGGFVEDLGNVLEKTH